MKLVKNVKIVINGVPTIYLWKKNEEKRLTLSEIIEFKVVRKCQQNVFKLGKDPSRIGR